MSDIPKGHIQLKGRLVLAFDVEAVTGLHIGGAFEGVAIGGVDKTVVRNPLTNQPYIPGSSLRGKMRSLVEKYEGKLQNQRINLGYIHSCQETDWATYPTCNVCQVFGVPGERKFATPARLIVRDTALSAGTAERLNDIHTDLPYTEVKVEVAIDRVTSQANPRQLERVPAGAIFAGGEMVYSLYAGAFNFGDKLENEAEIDLRRDLEHFGTVLKGMQLLEEDYLGGHGARGYGKVRFVNLSVEFRPGKDGSAPAIAKRKYEDKEKALAQLVSDWPTFQAELQAVLK